MTNASLKVNRTDEGSGKADRGVSHATHFRFGLAAVLHLTGRIADRVASAYDGLLSMDEKETAKIYFDMGTDLVHKGNSDDALAALRKTLELQPDNGDAWLYLGMVHSDRQEPDDAVEAFQQAITLGKDGPKLHLDWPRPLPTRETTRPRPENSSTRWNWIRFRRSPSSVSAWLWTTSRNTRRR